MQTDGPRVGDLWPKRKMGVCCLEGCRRFAPGSDLEGDRKEERRLGDGGRGDHGPKTGQSAIGKENEETTKHLKFIWNRFRHQGTNRKEGRECVVYLYSVYMPSWRGQGQIYVFTCTF
jgi:hypothetical protein